MTTSTTHPGSKVGRARRSPGQLWQVPMFLIGLLAIVGVAVSAPWRQTPQERELDQMVLKLRQGLDNNESGDVLVAQAENLKLRLTNLPARSAEGNFLIGSAYYRQAKNKQGPAANVSLAYAVEHLDKALGAGVAPGDRPALQYRLGYALYQQNTDVPRALELMTLGVEKGAEQPLQAYKVLLQAHLQRTPLDVDAARSAVRRVIDLTPERDVEALSLARVQHAELLMRKEMRAGAGQHESLARRADQGPPAAGSHVRGRRSVEQGDPDLARVARRPSPGRGGQGARPLFAGLVL
jgi:hypothetical protein